MAKNKSTVYLGYEDEEIGEKYKSLLNYSTNKVGGSPDWPSGDIKVPNCPLCNLQRPLVLQIYAPLENSQFHRTLFVFACLNSTCSNQSKSWTCIRTEHLDKSQDYEIFSGKSKPGAGGNNKIAWCGGADDWGENEEFEEMNANEENGNNIVVPPRNDNYRNSDDEDDSNSMENDIVGGFGALKLAGDDKNANCGGQGDMLGAFGTVVNIPHVFAEIEGEESEVVTVETPHVPEHDLLALLQQTSGISCSNVNDLTIKSFFLSVDEEATATSPMNYQGIVDHARELYQEYQKHDEVSARNSPGSPMINPSSAECGAVGGKGAMVECEQYENAIPAHGDIMFHNFVTTIQNNPGQILRYSRDAFPLLISPITEQIPKCQHCGSELICELQILPTIIPTLKLKNNDESTPIEFGNVLVFTCLKSCWDTPDKMRFEHVIVQQEN